MRLNQYEDTGRIVTEQARRLGIYIIARLQDLTAIHIVVSNGKVDGISMNVNKGVGGTGIHRRGAVRLCFLRPDYWMGLGFQDFSSGIYSVTADQALVIEGGEFKGKVKTTIAGNIFDQLNAVLWGHKRLSCA